MTKRCNINARGENETLKDWNQKRRRTRQFFGRRHKSTNIIDHWEKCKRKWTDVLELRCFVQHGWTLSVTPCTVCETNAASTIVYSTAHLYMFLNLYRSKRINGGLLCFAPEPEALRLNYLVYQLANFEIFRMSCWK